MRSSFIPISIIPYLLSTSLVSAFYLPGVAPTSYKEGDVVPLFVNRLTPSDSDLDAQVRSVISYDYYDGFFHFCKPDKIESKSESLGSILFGDRIVSSPFELLMKTNEECKTFRNCGPQQFEKEDAVFVNNNIRNHFNYNWLIDGLPAAQLVVETATGEKFSSPGFPLGSMEYTGDSESASEATGVPVFNNHYDIIVEYHEASTGEFRVVGVVVIPDSNRNSKDLGNGKADCSRSSRAEKVYLSEEGPTSDIVFTYSVNWQSSPTPFATRWDKYLHVYDPKIHWFSLINSAVIVIFLSGTVFVILVRTLKKDITRYNKLETFVLEDMSNGHSAADLDDGVQEDSGWKLIHGDVFRPPKRPLILAILVGNGAQLFMMTGFTIAFAMMGFLSPSNRGSLGSVMVLLYTFFGGIGGFVSSYTYKSLGGEDRWKQNILLTPIALPFVVFSTFFLLDLFLWAKGSSGAVPFTTMLVIISIWFLISVPLSFAGSWLAFKRKPITPPVRTNQIPRQIPDATTSVSSNSGISAWLIRPIPAIFLTGIPPFIAIFFELNFIMNSLWSAKIYYMFGFLFVCFGLMVVTCATVTVMAVYFLLCAENYHWQWRSFATGGACAIYVFLSALAFWASRLSLGSVTSAVLYLGYSALISLLVFVLTGMSQLLYHKSMIVANVKLGTIGFLASWIFVHRIYRSIKVD